MNMFEEARALRGMITMCSLTQREIAKKMNVSQSYIANKLRLLNFSDYIQMLIIDAGLTERHARLLLKLKGENDIKTAIQKIKTMRLPVSASEVLIDNMLVDSMPGELNIESAHDRIEKFDEIINLSLKNLESYGIKVYKNTDYGNKRRYITLCIEE